MFVRTYVHTYIRTHTYIHTYIRTHTHTHIHTYTYTYIHIYKPPVGEVEALLMLQLAVHALKGQCPCAAEVIINCSTKLLLLFCCRNGNAEHPDV